MTEEPVLRLPDYTVPFEVHTEASDYAIRRVLVQEGHPVAYESRKLNETERRGPRERDDSRGALPEDVEKCFCSMPFKTKKLFTPVEIVGITPAISAVCAIDSVVVISTVFGFEGITRRSKSC